MRLQRLALESSRAQASLSNALHRSIADHLSLEVRSSFFAALEGRSSRLPRSGGRLSLGLPPSSPATAGAGPAMDAGERQKVRTLLEPLDRFAAEPGADSFTTWLNRMAREVRAWRRNPDVAAGVQVLVARMEKNEAFRAECFSLAREAQGRCADRPLAGYNHMQAALLASRAEAGELSTSGLHDASICLFNRHALHVFAVKHACSQRVGDESLEVALYLETKLRDRLALPPNAADMRYEGCAVLDAGVDAAVLEQAVQHVQALHLDAGSQGLPAFLAGQGAVEFNPWVEHLRKKFPEKFEQIHEEVSAQQEALASHLGDTAAAREQAGVECKALWRSKSIDLVAQLTRNVLQESGAGADTGPREA